MAFVVRSAGTQELAAVASWLNAATRRHGGASTHSLESLNDLLAADPAAVLVVEDNQAALLGCCVRIDGETLDLVARSAGDSSAISALLAQARQWSRSRSVVWTAEHDSASRASLIQGDATVDYVDIQMQRTTLSGQQRALPRSTALVTVQGEQDVETLRALHALSCLAWGVPPWWDAFLDRFVRVPGFDPAYFVALARTNRDKSPVAAALGRENQAGGDALGVVSNLYVDPSARGEGLGTWVLGELLRRFGENGIRLAQLGVHADNASGAPALYRRLGWVEVSRATRWSLPG